MRSSSRPKKPTANKTAIAPRRRDGLELVGRATAVGERMRHESRKHRGLRPSVLLAGDFEQAEADGVVELAAASLTRRIRAHMARGTLAVTLTDNRYTMISVRRKTGPHYAVRLHHMFADADPCITRSLALYIGRNDPEASRHLGEFIDLHQHRVKAAFRLPANRKLVSSGTHHDLAEIFDDINRTYFDDRIKARITWGQRSSKERRRNSIKMGSYSVEDRLIRIHRSLDRAFIPRFFVEWIVYHEMLHQVHEVKVVGGRRLFHPPEFLEQEAQFAHYSRAVRWQNAHLDALLTY